MSFDETEGDLIMIAMYTFTALLVLIVGADSFALMNHRNSQSRRSKSLSLVRDAVPRSSIEVEKMEKSRAMVSLVGLTAGLLMGQLGGPRKAEALDLFPSADQQAVNAVSAFQKPVYELLNQLRPYDTPNALGIYSKMIIKFFCWGRSSKSFHSDKTIGFILLLSKI